MKLTIRTKIISLVVLAILVSIIIGYVGLSQLSAINEEIDSIDKNFNPAVEMTAEIEIQTITSEMHLEKFLRFNQLSEAQGQEDHSGEYAKKAKEYEEKFSVDCKEIDAQLIKLDQHFETAIKEVKNEHEKNELKTLSEHVKTIKEHHEDFQKHVKENVIAQYGKMNGQELEKEAEKVEEEAHQIRAKTDIFLTEVQKAMKDAVQTAEKLEANAQKIIITTCVVSGIVLIIFGTIIVLGIIRNLAKMVNMLKEIASGKGDLTKVINIDTGDEIAEMGIWFNQFISKLREIVIDVKHASKVVSSSSQQLSAAVEESNAAMNTISSTITEIATGMQENASAVEETSASVQEVAGSAESVARTSQETVESSTNAQKFAEKGSDAVKDILTSINEVAKSSIEVGNTISQLEESSNQIGEILNIISGIANQTNLLALNAAIEAARAGEHGRGFAVVAEEIRKLAEQSDSSTKEIASLVQGIQGKTSEVVVNVSSQEKKIHQSVDKAKLIDQNIKEILDSVNNVVIRINDIASASEEQAAATEQMSKSVDSVSKITDVAARNSNEISSSVQEQVSTLEEIGATTEEIASMSQLLDNQVNQFKTE